MNRVPFIPVVPSRDGRPKRTGRVLRRVTRLTVAIGVVGLPGCLETEPTEHRVIGLMRLDHPRIDWPLPQIPETATAGVPLEAVFWTGGHGCYRGADTEVVVTGRSAGVTPYAYLTVGRGCYTDLTFYEHRATLVFEQPGIAQIVLVYSTDGGYVPEDYKGDGRRVYTVDVSPAG